MSNQSLMAGLALVAACLPEQQKQEIVSALCKFASTGPAPAHLQAVAAVLVEHAAAMNSSTQDTKQRSDLASLEKSIGELTASMQALRRDLAAAAVSLKLTDPA